MAVEPNHYCIQADRIARMDEKLDDIHEQFQVDGTIGTMSKQLTRLTALIENGGTKRGNGAPPKIVYWIIAGLIAILATVLGVNLPLG